MVAFIDGHRGEYGVESICETLPIAPSTYYVHKARGTNPALLSDRAQRDAELEVHIRRVWDANFQVYGPRKVWRELKREKRVVARRVRTDVLSRSADSSHGGRSQLIRSPEFPGWFTLPLLSPLPGRQAGPPQPRLAALRGCPAHSQRLREPTTRRGLRRPSRPPERYSPLVPPVRPTPRLSCGARAQPLTPPLPSRAPPASAGC